MTKEVLICVSGTQVLEDGETKAEVKAEGEYFLKNDARYVIYDEVQEGTAEVIKNVIKIRKRVLEVRKSGGIDAYMVFEKGKISRFGYATPVGELIMEIRTNDIFIEEKEDCLNAWVAYSLDLGGQPVSECRLVLSVRSK